MSEQSESLNCNICHMPIIVGEEYCELSQFGKNWKFYKKATYHVACYRDNFLRNKKLELDAQHMMNRAFGIIDKIEGKT